MLDYPIGKTKVMVAMSGGVDSSVVAILLHRLGYQVLGVTLQLAAPSCGLGACCTGRDLTDVKKMCAHEGFEHILVLARDDFKEKVINYTVNAYAQGETPSPCVWCNSKVRFDHLYQTMQKYNCDLFVTGHYAYVTKDKNNMHALLSGIDPQKDQSYFLSMLPYYILEKVRFPLGNMHKTTVRKIAQKLGLLVANKKDSQDLCFVKESYTQTLWNLKPEIFQSGYIKDLSGKILGTHDGVAQFTIGQRKGLHNIDRISSSTSSALYVINIDATTQTVTVGDCHAISYSKLFLTKVNLFVPFKEGMLVEAKVRARSETFFARLWDNGNTIEFLLPIHVVARGQICVFYQGRKVIGAGLISNYQQSPIKYLTA